MPQINEYSDYDEFKTPGLYSIINKSSGKYLDLFNSEAAAGTAIIGLYVFESRPSMETDSDPLIEPWQKQKHRQRQPEVANRRRRRLQILDHLPQDRLLHPRHRWVQPERLPFESGTTSSQARQRMARPSSLASAIPTTATCIGKSPSLMLATQSLPSKIPVFPQPSSRAANLLIRLPGSIAFRFKATSLSSRMVPIRTGRRSWLILRARRVMDSSGSWRRSLGSGLWNLMLWMGSGWGDTWHGWVCG